MHGDDLPRRSVLALIGTLSLGGSGLVHATDEGGNETRDRFTILEGTEHETTGYVSRGDRDGPTILVVGGVHGDEEAGWVAADEITEWTVNEGVLVTIPRANPTAIDAGTRRGADGTDLNRQFPTNEEPQTDLAQAIWEVILEFEPDVTIDLHESTGIYAGDPVDGVGQAIFRSYHDEARVAAERAVGFANENYVDDPELEFMVGLFSGPETRPEGLLVHKIARELDSVAFLQETLRIGPELETRVLWQTVLVEQLLQDWIGLAELEAPDEVTDDVKEPDDGDDEDVNDNVEETEAESDDDEQAVPPTPIIETDPDSAAEDVVALDQTTTLSASSSDPGSTAIESFSWDVTDDGEFDTTGETIEVTISACGDFPVVLRVTNEDGLTEENQIVLSTG